MYADDDALTSAQAVANVVFCLGTIAAAAEPVAAHAKVRTEERIIGKVMRMLRQRYTMRPV